MSDFGWGFITFLAFSLLWRNKLAELRHMGEWRDFIPLFPRVVLDNEMNIKAVYWLWPVQRIGFEDVVSETIYWKYRTR